MALLSLTNPPDRHYKAPEITLFNWYDMIGPRPPAPMGFNLQQRSHGSLQRPSQAARARARGYCNVGSFVTVITLIAAPIADIIKSI
jgi:hypothetical protein